MCVEKLLTTVLAFQARPRAFYFQGSISKSTNRNQPGTRFSGHFQLFTSTRPGNDHPIHFSAKVNDAVIVVALCSDVEFIVALCIDVEFIVALCTDVEFIVALCTDVEFIVAL